MQCALRLITILLTHLSNILHLMTHVYFDILHLYYLPQYLPVCRQLQERGVKCTFVLYRQLDLNDIMQQYADDNKLDSIWVDDAQHALKIYKDKRPEWIIFGNAYSYANELEQAGLKTALMQARYRTKILLLRCF